MLLNGGHTPFGENLYSILRISFAFAPISSVARSTTTLSHEDAIEKGRYYVVLGVGHFSISVHSLTVATAEMGVRCDLPGSFRLAEVVQDPFEES